jgi:hypothetical protein
VSTLCDPQEAWSAGWKGTYSTKFLIHPGQSAREVGNIGTPQKPIKKKFQEMQSKKYQDTGLLDSAL